MKKVRVIILAAGKGSRMSNEVPKVLVPLAGKALIEYTLETLEAVNYDIEISLVVGYKAEMVKEKLGNGYHYVYQENQLGTGHAVQCSKDDLKDKEEFVMVINGDHPFILKETIEELIDAHLNDNATITMMTSEIPSFDDIYSFFKDFGRILRDEKGLVKGIVESKDATDSEKEIKEINPSMFCFNANWLWENIEKLENHNNQNEFYLTDLLKMAVDSGQRIHSIKMTPEECIGINRPEHIKIAEQVLEQVEVEV